MSALSIVIDNNEKLRELNKQFRGIDAPTDVLSFPSGEIDPETGETYLGDIIISWEKVQSQALQQTIECEMRLMVVHGILHLLGYDHATDTEQKRNVGLFRIKSCNRSAAHLPHSHPKFLCCPSSAPASNLLDMPFLVFGTSSKRRRMPGCTPLPPALS